MRVGYIIAMASVIAISGGFLFITLQRYAQVNIPCNLTIILTALAVLMMIRGVGLSTKIAGLFFGFEMLVLVVVCVCEVCVRVSWSGNPTDVHLRCPHKKLSFRTFPPGRGRLPAGAAGSGHDVLALEPAERQGGEHDGVAGRHRRTLGHAGPAELRLHRVQPGELEV